MGYFLPSISPRGGRSIDLLKMNEWPGHAERILIAMYILQLLILLTTGSAFLTKEEIYERRFDSYLIFLPEFTLEHLCKGFNLPDLIEEWIKDDKVKKGDIAMVNVSKPQNLNDVSFGYYISVNEPFMFLNGTGNTICAVRSK